MTALTFVYTQVFILNWTSFISNLGFDNKGRFLGVIPNPKVSSWNMFKRVFALLTNSSVKILLCTTDTNFQGFTIHLSSYPYISGPNVNQMMTDVYISVRMKYDVSEGYVHKITDLGALSYTGFISLGTYNYEDKEYVCLNISTGAYTKGVFYLEGITSLENINIVS